MSQVLASPLGDISLDKVTPRGWAIAGLAALALHLGLAAGWSAWQALQPPAAEAEDETMVTVALGPPGGRIEPAPPPVQAPPPAADLPKASRTERAADAPPIAMTAPAPPVPSNAALSSGFGSGGEGAEAPPAPPPPAPPPPPRRRPNQRSIRQNSMPILPLSAS